MGRACAGLLLAAVLALAGCKSTSDPKPSDRDREPTGLNASRNKGKDGKDAAKGGKQPAWLDSMAKLPGGDTGVPKAGPDIGDPNSPNFDAKAAAQDVVGGRVMDAFNRPAKDVFVRVTSAGDAPGTAAIGALTDGGGYFLIRKLVPGQSYTITAEATQDGKPLAGTVQTRVPNPVLTIVLREDSGLPRPDAKPAGPGTDGRGANGPFPPPPAPADGDHIPAAGLGPAGTAPRTNLPKNDDAFSPEAGATRPVPAAVGGFPPAVPTPKSGGALPEPDDLTVPSVRPAPRPENVAGGERNPFTPPSASIPGPVPPSYPVPPVKTPAAPDRKQSRVGAGGNFALVDTLGRNWDLASAPAGGVVLLEFVTTHCPHCKPCVPILAGLQSRHGADGLQVIAVLCDEVPVAARVAAADRYARANGVNYAVYVEPGASPGGVRDRFGVDAYPTAVLLDGTGAVLWKGHPGQKKADLEAAVRRALGK